MSIVGGNTGEADPQNGFLMQSQAEPSNLERKNVHNDSILKQVADKFY